LDDITPADPRAPKYWMHEVGGELAPAVGKYLLAEPLTAREISLIRAYLQQWIMSPVWDLDPFANADTKATLAKLRGSIDWLLTVELIRRWIAAATDMGIDPL